MCSKILNAKICSSKGKKKQPNNTHFIIYSHFFRSSEYFYYLLPKSGETYNIPLVYAYDDESWCIIFLHSVRIVIHDIPIINVFHLIIIIEETEWLSGLSRRFEPRSRGGTSLRAVTGDPPPGHCRYLPVPTWKFCQTTIHVFTKNLLYPPPKLKNTQWPMLPRVN